MGARRGQTLKNDTSTPGAVGPGRYAPQHSAFHSGHANFPRWTLPKAGRPEAGAKKPDRNQTYDTRSAFGGQPVSKNKKGASCHFGSSNRVHAAKQGTFKDLMQGGVSVKLHHAAW